MTTKTDNDEEDNLLRLRNRKNKALDKGQQAYLATLEGVKGRQTYHVDLDLQAYIKMRAWFLRKSEADIVNQAVALLREHEPFEGEIPHKDFEELLAPLMEKARNKRGK
jgi:hypothetical protein